MWSIPKAVQQKSCPCKELSRYAYFKGLKYLNPEHSNIEFDKMYRPLSSQHTLHHTHKTPSYPNLTLLLQSSTTLSLVPNTRLHLPLQLRSLSKQLSWLILNKAAVLAHPQQGVLLQEGLQDGLQVLLLQQVLFYRSLMITKMVNCYDRYLLWKRNISLR